MIFLSYHFPDESFVQAVNKRLQQLSQVTTFFYGSDQRPVGWQTQLGQELAECTGFVLFLGQALGECQTDEAQIAAESSVPSFGRVIVRTKASASLPATLSFFKSRSTEIFVDSFDLQQAQSCADKLIKVLELDNPFDLPDGYPFDYEKKIIEEYSAGNGRVGDEWVRQGCPAEWPSVEREKDIPYEPNPLGIDIVGAYRKESAAIVVDTRIGWRELDQSQAYPATIAARSLDKCRDNQVPALTFPEAGPRARLCYPVGGTLTVGILVSGGIAPGINAVIESIVKRHTRYRAEHKRGYKLSILGYLEGFEGFVRREQNSVELYANSVTGLAGQAGAKLRTSRADELLRGKTSERYGHFLTIIGQLSKVNILYVIGGEGSMKAAHAIWKISRNIGHPISVIGVPKTMDNDIFWVWQSFGFLSAVEEARKAILNLHTEAASNPRLCIIQLFGSDSGFVVSQAVLASGVCDAALIPEVGFAIKGENGLSQYICGRLRERLLKGESPSAVIVMAETAIPVDALDYVEDPKDEYKIRLFGEEKDAVRRFFKEGRRVGGQTPDELRSAGLKIVSKTLLNDIKDMQNTDVYWKDYRVFANEPRHLIRSIPPSVSDVIIGERLGTLAVDNAMAGYTDFMVSQWLTEYVLVPLKLVVLGRKRVPENGMFWKSVLDSTRQPPDMTK
jgi:6-phosphofructokinase 1